MLRVTPCALQRITLRLAQSRTSFHSPVYSWVDGTSTKTQLTSRPETIRSEVWSSMSKCAQKKAKQQWDFAKPQVQAARQMRTILDIVPDEVEQIDAIIPNARKKLEIPVDPAMPCVPPRNKHRKLQCRKEAEEEPLTLSEGRVSLSGKKRHANTSVRISNVYYSSRMKITLQMTMFFMASLQFGTYMCTIKQSNDNFHH